MSNCSSEGKLDDLDKAYGHQHDLALIEAATRLCKYRIEFVSNVDVRGSYAEVFDNAAKFLASRFKEATEE